MLLGWRYANKMPSLPEVHGSVKFPGPGAHWTRKFAAFVGLGFMVSVGYMDPGMSFLPGFIHSPVVNLTCTMQLK